MSENITITLTDNSEEITITLNENARGPAGSDAEVTPANVRAAVPNMVEVASPVNDDMIQRVGGSWVTRTIAQVRTALGLGSAAYTASTDYATAAQGALADTAIQEADLATVALTGNYSDLSATPDLTGFQDKALVVSTSQTVFNDGVYVVVATSTLTDPASPAEGKGFTVLVRNGTATVGGTAYATAGTIIRRIYHSGSYTNYVYKDLAQLPADLAATITAATSKATPVDADELPLADSAASFVLKKLTWANLKATAKTYFDTLYVALTGNQTVAGEKTFTSKSIFSTNTTDTLRIQTHTGGTGYDIGRSGANGLLRFIGDQAGFTGYDFLDADGSVHMRIEGNGNIGIANTTPSQALDVTGNVKVSGTLTVGGTNTWNGSTITGAQAFSSTTRPTSSGTGTPASNSLITRTDGDLRFLASPDVCIDGDIRYQDGISRVWEEKAITGSGSTAVSSFQIEVRTGSTTGSKAYRGMGTGISHLFGSDSSTEFGIIFDANWVFSLRAMILNAATNTDGYIVFGLAGSNTSTAQPSTKSFGLRIHDGLVYGFVHDGSTYTESSSILNLVGGSFNIYKYSFVKDGSSLKFYISNVLQATLTAPTGSTGANTGTIGAWVDNETSTNDFLIFIQGQIKFANIY